MISTSRTQIRPLKENDFELLISMYLEPKSNKYIAPLRNKSPTLSVKYSRFPQENY